MRARPGAAMNRGCELLIATFKGKALVRVQLPLRLDEFNEPQPAISVVKCTTDYYESRHPRAADVLLVLEISETSNHYDREAKLPIYAAARIADVWIEDLANDVLLVFRDPFIGRYRTSLTFKRRDPISLLAFPETFLVVEELLGPARCRIPGQIPLG